MNLYLCFLMSIFTVAKTQDCICLEEITSVRGLRNPVYLINGGDERIFIIEQVGVVWIVDINDDRRITEPFLDISDVVKSGNVTQDERGFLQVWMCFVRP